MSISKKKEVEAPLQDLDYGLMALVTRMTFTGLVDIGKCRASNHHVLLGLVMGPEPCFVFRNFELTARYFGSLCFATPLHSRRQCNDSKINKCDCKT
jgi:hypothetical protein